MDTLDHASDKYMGKIHLNVITHREQAFVSIVSCCNSRREMNPGRKVSIASRLLIRHSAINFNQDQEDRVLQC